MIHMAEIVRKDPQIHTLSSYEILMISWKYF